MHGLASSSLLTFIINLINNFAAIGNVELENICAHTLNIEIWSNFENIVQKSTIYNYLVLINLIKPFLFFFFFFYIFVIFIMNSTTTTET